MGTNFERQSIKYWVHPQDAMTVIMIIIRNLPVYSFQPSGAKGVRGMRTQLLTRTAP